MTAISGTVTYKTVVTVVAASSGDGDTIAAMFSGIVVAAISNTAATASNSSGTVTITWPDSSIRVGNGIVLTTVTNMIGANTSLTSPITVTATTQGSLTS